MLSIWDNQTIKPNEIILVQDGMLTDELYEVIEQWKLKLGDILQLIVLTNNVGLGEALNIGLHACSYPLIARMDTDDVAKENRFEKQLHIFEHNNIDICSSWVSEFDKSIENIVSYRKVPELHQDIIIFSKKRNPINHPAVMYKKSSVLASGGYKTMLLFEDYYLWIRMILQGAKFYNIQEALLSMRAGYGQLERRSGLEYALHEFKFQKELLALGYINHTQFFHNIIIRFTTRIIPKPFVRIIYQIMRKKS